MIDYGIFAIGFLNEMSLIHEKIVEKSQYFNKGVYICSLYMFQGKKLQNEVSIGFAIYNQVHTNGKSLEDYNISHLIKNMIKDYDREMVYCAAVVINSKIVASSLIPLQQPNRLEQLIDRAIFSYENS